MTPTPTAPGCRDGYRRKQSGKWLPGGQKLRRRELDRLPREDTYEVGSAPFNRSPFGVHDLAVNVWEWVGEPYGPMDEGSKLLRGGRHGFLRDMAYRQQAAPADPTFVELAGFRCAADQGEGE